MIPTKEQIQFVWELCGLKQTRKYDAWYAPNLPEGEPCGVFPKTDISTIDLNNLDRYALPKLFKKGLDIHLFSDDGYYFAYAVTNDLEHKRCFDSIVGTEDLALALFSTIYKALGGKE